MIQYNFKYRGPYEYEKFILNIFQFLNEMKDLQDTVEAETTTGLAATAEELKNKINTLLTIDAELAFVRERSLAL